MLKMSGHSQTSLLILSFLIPFSLFQSSCGITDACGIAVYWGRNGFEESLSSACATGNYKYVAIAFLSTFGSGQVPALNLDGHCDAPSGSCRKLRAEVQYCQSHNVKVLLSLGGPTGSYNLSSQEDARQVANYLWTTYLSGTSGSGPLGDVSLDGIDFDIEIPGSNLYWDVLAIALSGYSTQERKVYLAASPQCPFPDRRLDVAIRTKRFDYVWVHFYNNPSCDYRAGISSLLDSWNTWSSYLPSGQLFLGLPASPEAADGYIPSNVLMDQILPKVRSSPNYGGVMLWNRYYDRNAGYSSTIKPAVCTEDTSQREEL